MSPAEIAGDALVGFTFMEQSNVDVTFVASVLCSFQAQDLARGPVCVLFWPPNDLVTCCFNFFFC